MELRTSNLAENLKYELYPWSEWSGTKTSTVDQY